MSFRFVCADAFGCRRFFSSESRSVLVPHRRAVSLHCLLQVVVVGQNLHEKVKLQSLRLQDKIHHWLDTFPHTSRQNKHRWRLTCGFSLCTRRMQFEPYTTVFSGTTSHVLTWQHAPMIHPLVRITFLPRSAWIQYEQKDIFL